MNAPLHIPLTRAETYRELTKGTESLIGRTIIIQRSDRFGNRAGDINYVTTLTETSGLRQHPQLLLSVNIASL